MLDVDNLMQVLRWTIVWSELDELFETFACILPFAINVVFVSLFE
jgi:hypothetical protein